MSESSKAKITEHINFANTLHNASFLATHAGKTEDVNRLKAIFQAQLLEELQSAAELLQQERKTVTA